MKLTAESTVFNDEKVQNKFAELIVDADGIRTEVGKKVGNNEIISRINQSAESVSIDAGKVNISGVITAINNNTTTSIDGDKIATGSLSADRVDANSGTFSTANIPNLNASKITAGDISADRMKANSITAINSLTTGKINAARLDVANITVGQSQVTGLTTALANTQKLYSYTVDLSASTYDQSTWYPVLITANSETDASVYFKCSFVNGGGTPSWSTHSSKHWACDVEAYYAPSRWGWRTGDSSYINSYSFAMTSEQPIVFSNALSNTASLVVYLRGGGIYPIQTNASSAPQIKTSSYTISSQTVAPTTTQPVNSSVFVISRRDGDTKATNAAKTATTYITHIDDNGIRVHPASTQNNSVVINANGMEIFKGGTGSANSVAFYGDTARIGKASAGNVYITSNSIALRNGTAEYFSTKTTTGTIKISENLNILMRPKAQYSVSQYIGDIKFGRTVSTLTSVKIYYRLGNTAKTKTITSIPYDNEDSDKFRVILDYTNSLKEGIQYTFMYSSAATVSTLTVTYLDVQFQTAQASPEITAGLYNSNGVSAAMRIGNGTSTSALSNAFVVGWDGTGKFNGDVIAHCDNNSAQGISLSRTRNLGELYYYNSGSTSVIIDGYRCGAHIDLMVHVFNNSSVASGGNLFTLSNAGSTNLPPPAGRAVSGCAYYGARAIIATLYFSYSDNEWKFNIRNASNTAVTLDEWTTISMSYLISADETWTTNF